MAGVDKIKVSLAACCSPVYGDDIVGYITKGNGISIHRSNCHNLARMDDRCIQVNWSDVPASKYESDVVVYTNTTENKLADIIQKTSKLDINISEAKIISRTDTLVYEMSVYVKNTEHLTKLLLELEKAPYITNVERLIK